MQTKDVVSSIIIIHALHKTINCQSKVHRHSAVHYHLTVYHSTVRHHSTVCIKLRKN